MSGSRLVRHLEGRKAITIWSWIATAPFALTFMSGLPYVAASDSGWDRLAVAATAHVGVGVLLLVLRVLHAVIPRGARAGAAFLGFAAIGVARPFLFLLAGGLLGVQVQAADLPSRVGINVVACVVSMTLVALCVGLVGDHRGVFQRLRTVQRAAQAEEDALRARIEELRASRTVLLLETIESQVRGASQQHLDAVAGSSLLRTLANDVVRPLSHELYEADNAVDGPLGSAGADGSPPRRREWLASVLAGLQPAPAFATAVLFTLPVVPYAIGTYGIGIAGVQAVVAISLAGLGNLAVTALAARTRRPVARAAVLVGGYTAVGALLVAESTALLSMLGLSLQFVWFQVRLYPITVLTVAFVGSLTTRLRSDEREIEASLLATVGAADRMRAAYEFERVRLAHLLHSTVQSDLIASALALRADGVVDATEAVHAVVDRIRGRLSEAVSEPDARVRVERLVATWSAAMPVQARIGEDVWPRLVDDARCEAVIGAVSEGLVNAVRHGDGSMVIVAISVGGNGLRVVVTSGGTVADARPGIGLRDLARTADVLITQRPGAVELAVSIP